MPSTPLPVGLAPFRHRSFALVWTGALVSNVGSWMETTALSFYVADTSKASASGLVAAAGFLPTAFLAPVAGAWADRFDRRHILMTTNSISMVIGAIVAVLVTSGEATPGWLALCSLAAGCTSAIGFPAFQAVLPDLVPAEELVAAIGLTSTQWNLGRILGPTAAAVAISLGGIGTALWVNAASFAAVIVAVAFASVPHRVGVVRPIWRAFQDGVRFARTTPAVRAMVPVMLVTVFLASPFIGFIAQMATNVFDGDARSTSVLVTAQGVGAVAAGMMLGPMSNRFGVRRLMAAAVVLIGPALVLYGSAPSLPVAALALVVVGGCYMTALSSFTSVTQQSAPPELRGRAMAVNNVSLGAAYPLGLLVQGVLADHWSLRAVTISSGVAMLAVVVIVRLLRPGQLSPIDELAIPTAAPTTPPATPPVGQDSSR